MSHVIRKAYQDMCTSVPGSYTTVASQLGMSESALENRIYERKGQAVSVRDALNMQRNTGRADFAEAVAAESGGVFVRLPDAEFAEEDIQAAFMSLSEYVGVLVTEWRDVTDDGELTTAEEKRLRAVQTRLCSQAAAIIALTRKYYTVGD